MLLLCAVALCPLCCCCCGSATAAALLLCMLCCGSTTAGCLLLHSHLPLVSVLLLLPPSVCPFTTPTGTHTLHTSTHWLPQRSVPIASLGNSAQKTARPSAQSVPRASTPVLPTELRRAPGAQLAGSRHIQVLEAGLSPFTLTLAVLCQAACLCSHSYCALSDCLPLLSLLLCFLILSLACSALSVLSVCVSRHCRL